MATDSDDAYEDLMSVIDPTAIWVQKKLRISRVFLPHYNELLVELMSYGHTFSGACGRMGIPLRTGKRWVDEYADWAEAKEIGEQARQYHLEVALNYKATGRIHPGDLLEWQERNPGKDLPNCNLQAIMFSLKTVHKEDYSEKIITENMTPETDADKPKGIIDAELQRQLETFRRSIKPTDARPTKVDTAVDVKTPTEPSSQG